MSSVTSVSFFKLDNLKAKWWAFKQMRLAHYQLKGIPELKFYKLMGSGAGQGFSLKPDWSVYVFLGVWENEAAFQNFRDENEWFSEYREKAGEEYSLLLKAFKAKGSWNSQSPFNNQGGNPKSSLMAVLTRASIKKSMLFQFWRYVPGVSDFLSTQRGLIYAKGIGEWPLVEQATFSLWNSTELMQSFAYQQKKHAEVVKKTRELGWYSEELFARFEPVKSWGSWKDKDLLTLEAS